jgi:hypothetical protein
LNIEGEQRDLKLLIFNVNSKQNWIPAFAGMTGRGSSLRKSL